MDDCIIIGAGPAGLTAAIYLTRFHLRIRLFDCGSSRAALIPRTHNHAGYPGGVKGTELLRLMLDQAEEFGAVREAAEVTEIGDPATIPVSESRQLTEAQARTWVALGRKVGVDFEKPASLQAVVDFLKGARRGKGLPNGLSVYLDTVALSEYDIDPDSRERGIVLSLADVSLRSALALMLRQVGLIFRVDAEGVVVVEHKDRSDADADEAPDIREIEALRREVAQLRRGVVASRSGGPTLHFRVAKRAD